MAAAVLTTAAELRLIGQDDAGRFGRRHDDEAVPIGKPVAGERVDLAERDAGDEPAVEGELLPDRWQRFVLEEIARVFVRAARRLAVRALRHDALGAEHHRLLRAGELGRREAEACHALKLGDERVKTARHAVVGDERLEHRLVLRPRCLETAHDPRRP